MQDTLIEMFYLFLLDPVTGAVDQMRAEIVGARCRFHFLECAGCLIGAPVAFARNKHRRDVDAALGEDLLFAHEGARHTELDVGRVTRQIPAIIVVVVSEPYGFVRLISGGFWEKRVKTRFAVKILIAS